METSKVSFAIDAYRITSGWHRCSTQKHVVCMTSTKRSELIKQPCTAVFGSPVFDVHSHDEQRAIVTMGNVVSGWIVASFTILATLH